ncbi:MAG: phage tail sheath family protein [Selenomonadaceae bacterium]|nr:phage tail sheath family protein [Selenomonadaceae bacterium]
MAYKHGIYPSETPTSLRPMVNVDSGVVVAVGTAPVHLAAEPAEANRPILCYTYAEAVKQLGYSSDFDQYTLCEVMSAQFVLFGMAPVVFINVLDPLKHKTSVSQAEVPLVKGVAKVTDAVIKATLKVKDGIGGNTLVENEDYTAEFDDDGVLVITDIAGGEDSGLENFAVSYDKIDPSLVTAADIIGGISLTTGQAKGLELIEEVFPRFRIVPGTILAPKYSTDPAVAAVMKAKATNINTVFRALAIADIDTEEVGSYTEAPEYKNKNNLIDTALVVTYPKVSLGGTQYHLSTQLAAAMNRTDYDHGDIPYKSPSNESLQCDSSVRKDGTEMFLTPPQANYLNGQGIVTAINWIGGWRVWGNRTSDYPSNTDVKDNFINERRMFNWIGNTLVTSFWSRIDDPTNKRLIESIVNSANIWFNGLTAAGAILGGRVEFLEEENQKTALMDGIIKFHVYATPCVPARDIEFVMEFDPDYFAALFS